MSVTNLFTAAIESGDTRKVRELLTTSPDLSRARHSNGVSMLLWALYSGQPAMAEYLASNRSDLDIFEAAALGKIDQLAELLIQDRQLSNAWSVDGFQPLGLACFFKQPAAACLLIEAGAAVDSPSNNRAKVMPLHSAVAAGQVETARLLLRKGAPVNARQAGNFTALHSSAQNGSIDMLDLLLAFGADLDVRSDDGMNPLDFAIQRGHTELARRLRTASTTRRVILKPYDPTWPVLFRTEATRLVSLFEPLLGAIYHIGSTSVPGLLSKPTIDVLIEVKDLASVDQMDEKMLELGYLARGENGIPERRYYVKQEKVNHLVHVHVFQIGNPEIHRHLAFRDFLRRHPETSQAYGDLKEELAIRHVLDPEAYTNGKEPFVREIDRLAAEEEDKK